MPPGCVFLKPVPKSSHELRETAPRNFPGSLELARLLVARLRQTRRVISLALLAAVAVAGCVTEPEEVVRVRPGTTREDFRFYFGEPLRIEPMDTGGEVWYYRVASPSPLPMDGAVWQDPYAGSGGVAVSVSPSTKTGQECPIFFSAEGRVIEPVPDVAIRGR